jgi:WD repeat-containing protein 61
MSKSKVPTATNTISNIKNADKENVSSSSLFDQQYSLITVINDAHDEGIWSVIWTKATNRIITGSLDDKLKIWNSDHYTLASTLTGHSLGIVSLTTSQQGLEFASSSLDNQFRIWDLKLAIPSIIHVINAGSAEAWKIAFSPDGKYIASSSHSGNINIWNAVTGTKKTTIITKGTFGMSITYSPNGMLIAMGTENGIVFVYDAVFGTLRCTFKNHKKPVRAVVFSPNSNMLASASDDNTINLYELSGSRQSCVCTLKGHTSWVLCLSFSSDGIHLASGSSDKTIKIWDVEKKVCVHTFSDHSDQVWGVAYNPDGLKLVSVAEDGTMIIHKTTTQQTAVESNDNNTAITPSKEINDIRK